MSCVHWDSVRYISLCAHSYLQTCAFSGIKSGLTYSRVFICTSSQLIQPLYDALGLYHTGMDQLRLHKMNVYKTHTQYMVLYSTLHEESTAEAPVFTDAVMMK